MGDSRGNAYGAGVSDRAGRVLPDTAAAPKALTAFAWLAVALLAIVNTWPFRYRLVNLDCVSYLDIADAWRTLPWREAVNGYWSPLYSWILAAALAIVRPAPQHEYVLVHGVNVLLFLIAFGAYQVLFAEIRRGRADEGPTVFSTGELLVITTSLFLWVGLTQLVVWMESPDLIVAACVFLASAMLLRLQRGGGSLTAVTLGIALGVGYLAKAAMFPLAFMYLGAAVFAARHARMRRPFAAALVFLLIAAPWVAALSTVKGRMTTGDVGRLNYLWFVTRSEEWPKNWPIHWPHWDGVEGKGTLTQSARRLHDDPAVYEFATPFGATYPMWYDASYWHEGVSPQLDLRDQVRRLRLSAADLHRLLTVNIYNRDLWNPQPALLAVLMALWFARGRVLSSMPRATTGMPWVIVLPAAATVALYAVVYIEPRYLGGALLVLWTAAIARVRAEDSEAGRRLLRGAAIAMTVVTVSATAAVIVYDGIDGWRRALRGEADEVNQPWHVASIVRGAGVQPGEQVGVIGSAQVASRWARLGRVRITAEVPLADSWKVPSLDPARLRSVLDAFARAGVTAVLSEQAPAATAREGWVQLAGTSYWMYRL